MLSTALHILGWWFALAFLAGAWLCFRGWLLSRKQDRVRRQRFAWPHEPIRVLDWDASQWERVR